MSSTAPLTFGERVGLILLAETSAVSASAILALLSYIAYSAASITRGAPRRWRIEGPAEVYFLNQLVWDLFQATGGLMNIRWAMDGSVSPGPICTAQGAVKQASDVGAAISTSIIAIYTIMTLCFSKTTNHDDDQVVKEITARSRRHDLRLSLRIVVFVWIFVGLLLGINIAVDKPYHFYGPTGLWCWIKPKYSVKRTAIDFVFMWITAAFNIVIYIILFFYLRGYITTIGWRMYLSCTVTGKPTIVGPKKQAYGLLFYPLVYTAAILPLSIARYRTFAHHHVRNAVIIGFDIIYLSNGLFNVLLFSITRPFLLPHDLPSPDTELPIIQVGPPEIEDPNDRTDIEAPAVRHDSSTPNDSFWQGPDLIDGGLLRWSPEGVAYVTNSQSPSTISVGV